jgi:L-threonylcarbamoyladenylate synthase
MVIDGGPCHHGVESTIVMLGDRPKLLRPGSITAEVLALRLGVDLDDFQSQGRGVSGTENEAEVTPAAQSLLAPGMMREHYAPATPLVLLYPDRCERQIEAGQVKGTEQGRGAGMGRIAFHTLSPEDSARYRLVETLSDHGDFDDIARNLFASLRRMDQAGLAVIHCDTCQPIGLGLAIMDRLRRAAARTESTSQGE